MQTILLYYFLTIGLACSGQNKSQISNKTATDKTASIAIGDTVTVVGDSIWIIFQDRDGHYWFGSNGEGVYRYDPSPDSYRDGLRAGRKTIIRFTTKHGLSNDSIRDIQQDKSGNMYFSTLNGICKYDGHTISEMIPVKSANPQADWKLEPDDLWFKGNSELNGPYRLSGDSLYDLDFPKHELEDELYAITGDVPWSNHGVYIIYKDSKGNIWFGTSAFGACRYDGKSLTWISEKEITFLTDAFGVRAIIEDEDGWMWLTNSIYRYKIDSSGDGTYKKEKGIGNGDCDYFQSIVRDDHGNYWMVTYMGGVWRYNPSDRKMSHFPVMESGTYIPLFSIYKDKQGVLWLGTQENGVYRFNGNAFEKFEF